MTKQKKTTKKNDNKNRSTAQDSGLNQFYTSIIETVEKNLEEKNFKKAMELISDELEAPYIPMEYETIFQDLFKRAKVLEFESKQEELSKKPVMELINIVNSDLSNNFETYSFILDKYHEKLTSQEWHKLSQIFVSEKTSNAVKLSALFLLSQVSEMKNKKIKYYNERINYFDEIIIHENLVSDYESKFKDISIDLEKIFYKNPSKYEHAMFILDLLTGHFFPTDPILDNSIFSKGIINYIECSYSDIRNYQDFLESLNLTAEEIEKNLEIFEIIINMLSNIDAIGSAEIKHSKIKKEFE